MTRREKWLVVSKWIEEDGENLFNLAERVLSFQAQKAGRTRSIRKAESSRANGRLGGRPKK